MFDTTKVVWKNGFWNTNSNLRGPKKTLLLAEMR